MIRALIFAAVLQLTACAGGPAIRDSAPPPLFAACSASCLQSCAPRPWPTWQGDPDAPLTWHLWPDQVGRPLREAVERCDAARASCVACLRGLEIAGAVCGVASECGG